MKLKYFLRNMPDTYQTITIEEIDNDTNLVKERYYIKPHSNPFDIPEDVLEMDFDFIIPFINGISIGVR